MNSECSVMVKILEIRPFLDIGYRLLALELDDDCLQKLRAKLYLYWESLYKFVFRGQYW